MGEIQVSTSTACLPESGWASLTAATDAASGYIRSLLKQIDQPMRVRTQSSMDLARFERPRSLLIEAFSQASKEAQTNEEQATPSLAALREAIALLGQLPESVEPPEPVIEPSGAVAWTWDFEDGRFLVLAVRGQGRVERSAVVDGIESFGRSPLSDRLGHEEHLLLKHFRSAHA